MINVVGEFIHKTLDADNHNEIVTGLFLDLSKAFDLVDHNILLEKINSFDFRGNTLSMIKSYLALRTKYTVVFYQTGDKFSTYRSNVKYVSGGVPQDT